MRVTLFGKRELTYVHRNRLALFSVIILQKEKATAVSRCL